jgi:type IV pilus assembly protein PilM
MASIWSQLKAWAEAPAETRVVCEIAADYVAAVRHNRRRVEAWAVRGLPPGTIAPAPLAENIVNLTVLQEPLEHVLGAVADGQRRCALVLPDLTARVALLEFDQFPARTAEADALVRWRLNRDLPFDLSQAVLSFQSQSGRSGGQEVLAAVCLRRVVRQYEEQVERLGLQPGTVTLSTLAALGCLETAGGPRLLVKPDAGSLGLSIADGKAVRLFRSLPLARSNGGPSAAALLEKIYPAVVFYQDQWNQPLSEVVVTGGGDWTEPLAREAGCAVRTLEVERFDLPPSPVSGAAPDWRLLPCLGWALGEA